MSEHIYISAVIPTYNREKTIRRAIDSVFSQDYAPSEVIVVDDGSTDNTQKIVETYGDKIRYVYQENAGVSAARNRGVLEAKFEWIAFLDSDDYWLNYHLRQIVNAIEATEGKAPLYFSDIRMPSDEGGILYWDFSKFKINGSFEIRQDASEWALMARQPMMLQASVIRRKSYFEVGGLPENMLTREDTLLFHKLCLGNPACAVSGCGAVMTSDGHKDSRLTVMFDGKTSVFWDNTITLYKQLLVDKQKISRAHRKLIIERMVKAHISLGRLFFREGNFYRMFENIFRATLINPGLCTKNMTLRLKRFFDKKIRGGNLPAPPAP